MTVALREVTKEDLPIFFEHQLDAEATRMAAFPSRDRDAFMAHWARIMSKRDRNPKHHPRGRHRGWQRRLLGSGGGSRTSPTGSARHIGEGIASAALAQFLTKIEARPVYAHCGKAQFRFDSVLQKCGFQLAREDMCDGDDGEELVMELRSDRCATAANKPTKT